MSEGRTYAVRRYIDGEVLKQDMAIKPTDLSGAMIDQSSLLVHYGELAAKASRQVDDVKMLLENTEAAVYRRLRDEAATNGEKITEASLEKSVSRHVKVIAMKKALNEARQIENVAKIAVEGFRHRRDMLVQLGAHERQEMQGELSMRVRQDSSAQYEETKNSILERRREK